MEVRLRLKCVRKFQKRLHTIQKHKFYNGFKLFSTINIKIACMQKQLEKNLLLLHLLFFRASLLLTEMKICAGTHSWRYSNNTLCYT